MILKSYIPFYKRNLNLAFPVMITQAGQMIVTFADNIMVGHLDTVEFSGGAFSKSIFVNGMLFCVCFTHVSELYIGYFSGIRKNAKLDR